MQQSPKPFGNCSNGVAAQRRQATRARPKCHSLNLGVGTKSSLQADPEASQLMSYRTELLPQREGHSGNNISNKQTPRLSRDAIE